MVGVAGSYAITGPARGAILPIMLLVIVFGVFALTPAQSRAMSGFGVCLLAGVMVYKGATDPLRYEPVVEALHLVFTAIVVGAVSALASRLSQLRSRLVDQRQQLAAALERIQAMATRDDLTGLLNRRAAMERFTEALGALPRRSAVASVVLIDLDHFKAVNDTHGHAAGDEVLRGFAEVARASLRTHDLLARWGGEEFLLVLPGADPADAAVVLARLREELAGRTFDAAAPGLRVTFSAGVARCGGLDDVEASIARADAAMYGAKTGGRNRTELTA
jgi:diguanylate cyclase